MAAGPYVKLTRLKNGNKTWFNLDKSTQVRALKKGGSRIRTMDGQSVKVQEDADAIMKVAQDAADKINADNNPKKGN